MATSFEVSHSSSGHATEKRNKQNLLGPCQNTCFESDGLHSKQWLYIKERENKARNIYRLAVLAATLMVHLFVFLTKGLFTTENSTHKQLTNIRGIHTTLSTIQLLKEVIITLKNTHNLRYLYNSILTTNYLDVRVHNTDSTPTRMTENLVISKMWKNRHQGGLTLGVK